MYIYIYIYIYGSGQPYIYIRSRPTLTLMLYLTAHLFLAASCCGAAEFVCECEGMEGRGEGAASGSDPRDAQAKGLLSPPLQVDGCTAPVCVCMCVCVCTCVCACVCVCERVDSRVVRCGHISPCNDKVCCFSV
jgi:hypothetical protein